MSNNHPIMVTLRDVISGTDFLAGITLAGRALMRNEDGQWWMYGVRPAGIAESGGTIDEAFLRFRNRYKEVLFDLAEENKTFDSFRLLLNSSSMRQTKTAKMNKSGSNP